MLRQQLKSYTKTDSPDVRHHRRLLAIGGPSVIIRHNDLDRNLINIKIANLVGHLETTDKENNFFIPIGNFHPIAAESNPSFDHQMSPLCSFLARIVRHRLNTTHVPFRCVQSTCSFSSESPDPFFCVVMNRRL